MKSLNPAGDVELLVPGKIAIPATGGTEYYAASSIIMVKGAGNYSYLHLADGAVITVTKQLGEIHSILSPYGFRRTHNSYVINPAHVCKHIKGDGSKFIMTLKLEALISDTYRKELLGK
jgi:DNA-binding LytR/AlgR family response regulator